MGGADAKLVEMALEQVAGVRHLLETQAARVRWSTVVPRERRRDHLVAHREIRKYRLPVAPVAGEPMKEDHWLALPGAVQRR